LKDEQEQEQEESQESAGEVKELIERFKTVLGEKVKDVRTTTRLTTSPACLVVGEYDLDPSLKRLLKAAGQTIPNDQPILEINPHHPIILKLRNEADDKRFTDWAYILFDQSVLSMGEKLDNPVDFVNRLNDLLAQL
jgi:molecular chaperone HtpG